MAENYEHLFNCDVIDSDGAKVGEIGQVYLDDHTGQPSWVTVKTGLFGLKETFVPLAGAVMTAEQVTVPYSSDLIKDAPRVDPDEHLTADEEAELYSYYGLGTDTPAQVDAPVPDTSADDIPDVIETAPARAEAEPAAAYEDTIAEPVTEPSIADQLNDEVLADDDDVVVHDDPVVGTDEVASPDENDTRDVKDLYDDVH